MLTSGTHMLTHHLLLTTKNLRHKERDLQREKNKMMEWGE